MAQYCRYCSSLIVGDFPYCEEKKKVITEKVAKTTNRCKKFDLNEIDAFGENEKGYTPRTEKKPKQKECGNQLSLFDIENATKINRNKQGGR